MSLGIEFDFCTDETRRCKGKDNTDKANCEGEYFGNIVVKKTRWAIILWDGDENPEFYDTNTILLERWNPIP